MYFVERGCNSTNMMTMETRLGMDRIIFVNGEINEQTANDFIKQMMVLNLESPDDLITVCINSGGGEIQQGLLMYDAIQGSRAPVRLVCTGQACSMAAILLYRWIEPRLSR